MALMPILALSIFLGLWYLSARIMESTLDTLSRPMDKIVPRTHAPSDEDLRSPMRLVENWAREHGFEDDVMFDFRIQNHNPGLFCRTWKNIPERTYLVFYAGLGKQIAELVTIYDDKTGVTTTNATDAHNLPAVPGAFIQAFPGLGLSDLHTAHQEGCRTLERRTGLARQEREEDTLDLITHSLTRQARYVRSIPGWRWKGLWWILIRKRWMIGKDVGWQLDQFGVFEPDPPKGILQ